MFSTNTSPISRADVTLEFEMTFFFHGRHRDQLFLFTESWDLVGTSPLSPAQRQSMIVEARLPLLVPCASIVQCKLTGQPLQRINRPGTAGGNVLFPFKTYILRNAGYATRRSLRAAPMDLSTPAGTIKLANYSRALNQAGAVIFRTDERIPVRPVERLEVSHSGRHKVAPALFRELVHALGEEKAKEVWDAVKK
jgi:hypothetical protein